jgi:hypothetical protein
MLPSLTNHDVANGRLPDAEEGADLFVCKTTQRVKFADGPNFIFGQAVSGVVAPTLRHVYRVVFLSPEVEVRLALFRLAQMFTAGHVARSTDTRRVIAPVKDETLIRERAVMQLVGIAMGEDVFATGVNADVPITLPVQSPRPRPAAGRLFHSAPKADFRRWIPALQGASQTAKLRLALIDELGLRGKEVAAVFTASLRGRGATRPLLQPRTSTAAKAPVTFSKLFRECAERAAALLACAWYSFTSHAVNAPSLMVLVRLGGVLTAPFRAVLFYHERRPLWLTK